MDILEIASLFRGVERLLIVAGGIIALYLGYRLFVSGLVGGQTGELIGKSLSVRLVRVGPGIFFALFGTCVLIVMTWQNIVTSTPKVDEKVGTLTFFGISEKSRIERVVEDIGAIKVMVAAGSESRDNIVKVLTNIQESLVHILLGDKIYEGCKFGKRSQSEQDCQIFRKLVK